MLSELSDGEKITCNTGVGGSYVCQENVSGGDIFLGNSVLPDRIYCPPWDTLSSYVFNSFSHEGALYK